MRLFRQHDSKDCGIACLRMIAAHYGRKIDIQQAAEKAGMTRQGVSLLGISQTAEETGFQTTAVKISTEELKLFPLPAILLWRGNHFVVLYKIKRGNYYIADPAAGKFKYSEEELLANWNYPPHGTVAMALEPTDRFYHYKEATLPKSNAWKLIKEELKQHRARVYQLLGCIILASLFQFCFPFLTQAVVDRGIRDSNLRLVELLLLAQFVLFFAQAFTEFARARILLFISTRINFSILGAFWKKLMQLPLPFFETKNTGDILQRINDHRRIEFFITGMALNSLFSFVSLLVFSVVLFTYRPLVFLVFLAGSILYFTWIRIFLVKRKKIDQERFIASAAESSKAMQIIQGMQEIKLNGAEERKTKEWQYWQDRLFNLNFRSLSVNQYQQAGAFFINQAKNILITFMTAVAVVHGQMTLGEMMAVQFMIGQLNGPVEQLVQFTRQAQEARLSLERLVEIERMENEEPVNKIYSPAIPKESIQVRQLNFSYPGADEPVLANINLEIPARKVTALVGLSGSGKTTLIRILLGILKPNEGSIRIGNTLLSELRPSEWRSRCGTVLQDGYIFSDTIAGNIALGDEEPDEEKIWKACEMAEIASFVRSLPQGLNTRIGAEGNGLSGGQKQRILIARAIYKDPSYLFFDEATNALDANNERRIMENLQEFFRGRTVVISAHRLSTIINADKIIVIDKGKIVEQGTHSQLMAREGIYHELICHQLPEEAGPGY